MKGRKQKKITNHDCLLPLNLLEFYQALSQLRIVEESPCHLNLPCNPVEKNNEFRIKFHFFWKKNRDY